MPLLLLAAISIQPYYTLHKDSQLHVRPEVKVVPLRVTDGARPEEKRNVFTFGEELRVQLEVKLNVPILAGATGEAWLSTLSLGNLARVAANKFIRFTDVCAELGNLSPALKRELSLPSQCPVEAASVRLRSCASS